MGALITFNAADIHLEGVEVNVELTPSWFQRTLGDTEVSPRAGEREPGRLSGRLSRSGNDIVVRMRVRAAVEIPCVRCLEPTSVEVDADMSLLLEPARTEGKRGRRQEPSDEYEFSAPEADMDVYDGDTVVLDPFVRETILLEVPSFPLCRESCPGIAAAPPSEPALEARELDPRLAPLGAFRKNDGPATLQDLIAAANDRRVALGRKPILRSNHNKKGKKKRS